MVSGDLLRQRQSPLLPAPNYLPALEAFCCAHAVLRLAHEALRQLPAVCVWEEVHFSGKGPGCHQLLQESVTGRDPAQPCTP